MHIENLKASLALVAVTSEATPAGEIVAASAAAVQGGATMIQLRRKHLPAADLVALARALRTAIGVPLIINDNVSVAIAAGAQGVHLGTDDLPPDRVRAMAPAGFIIGVSVGSEDEIGAGRSGDYWGVGPWRTTSTKTDAGPALGTAEVARLAGAAGSIPWVAIGGVRPDDVAAARAAGAAGVAVVSGIFGAADIAAEARRYRGA